MTFLLVNEKQCVPAERALTQTGLTRGQETVKLFSNLPMVCKSFQSSLPPFLFWPFSKKDRAFCDKECLYYPHICGGTVPILLKP